MCCGTDPGSESTNLSAHDELIHWPFFSCTKMSFCFFLNSEQCCKVLFSGTKIIVMWFVSQLLVYQRLSCTVQVSKQSHSSKCQSVFRYSTGTVYSSSKAINEWQWFIWLKEKKTYIYRYTTWYNYQNVSLTEFSCGMDNCSLKAQVMCGNDFIVYPATSILSQCQFKHIH